MPAKLEPITGAPHAYASTATELRGRLTEGEAQYLAGLIDGEGAIFIRVHSKQDGKQHLEIKVSIGLAHPIIIELVNKYGGLWYYYDRKEKKTKSGKSYKPFYVWEWQHPMIRLYFPQLLPYLKLKREQAEIMLEAVTIAMKRKARARTDEDREFFRQVQKRLYELNHKLYPCDISKYEHLKIGDVSKNPKCPKCDSKTYKKDKYTNKHSVTTRRYKCVNCGFTVKVKLES